MGHMSKIRLHWVDFDRNGFRLFAVDMGQFYVRTHTVCVQIWFKRGIGITYELDIDPYQ
jgi:hypothetical protein